MINFTDKSLCCGCSACVQVCPKSCISFEEDNEGFRYPRANHRQCIDCSLCEKVCPVLNRYNDRPIKSMYAARNRDEDVRKKSSSGGVFSLIAESIIKQGGVVFGARFDDSFEVVLDVAASLEQLDAFRGSKYLQAIVGDSYKNCKVLLDAGRPVLFTGTPCQISGLLHFLRKPYPNLLTIDFICHGVPSPGVWRNYLKEVVSSGKQALRDAKFRKSRRGWKRYGFAFDYDTTEHLATFYSSFEKNPYIQAFLKNVILRPSCYACPAKNGSSMSDLTLADFWGIEHLAPELDDDIGTSLVIVHTEKGRSFIPFDKLKSKRMGNEALQYNPSYFSSSIPNPNRDGFFHNFSKSKNLNYTLVKYSRTSFRTRVFSFIYKLLGSDSVSNSNSKSGILSTRKWHNGYVLNPDINLDDYYPVKVSFRDKTIGWKHYLLKIAMVRIKEK